MKHSTFAFLVLLFIFLSCFHITKNDLNKKYPSSYHLGLSKITLSERIILNNRIKIKLPNEYRIIPESEYPPTSSLINKPELAFLLDHPYSVITFTLYENYPKDLRINDVTYLLRDKIQSSTGFIYLYSSGVLNTNSNDIGYLEYLSSIDKINFYNYTACIRINNKLLIIDFNCLEENKSEMHYFINEIIDSLFINT